MIKISVDEFKKNFSEYIERTRSTNERIAVTKHGKVIGGFVSAEDLKLLEDNDVGAYDRGIERIKKNGTISLEEFKEKITFYQ